jgi:hypothetical protein
MTLGTSTSAQRAAARLLPAVLLLGACGDTWGERAATGGAIGAVAGAGVGAATGGLSILGGALIGGAAGAVIGAATTPSKHAKSEAPPTTQ